MPLTLEIVTPENRVYNETVESVVLPTVEGDVGILPGHLPLLTMLEAGELQAVREGKTEYLAVDKGFARLQGDKISVLTEAAIDVQQIDLSKVQEARERAEAALKEARENPQIDPAEIEKLEQVTRFAIAQSLAKSRKR